MDTAASQPSSRIALAYQSVCCRIIADGLYSECITENLIGRVGVKYYLVPPFCVLVQKKRKSRIWELDQECLLQDFEILTVA